MTKRDDCVFCEDTAPEVFASGPTWYARWDKYPVSPGHALIVPKEHVFSWFGLTQVTQEALALAIQPVASEIDAHGYAPLGYNIGMNLGEVAGQTISHLHIHIIPRYLDDVKDPRGGIRWVVPDKAAYWENDK